MFRSKNKLQKLLRYTVKSTWW